MSLDGCDQQQIPFHPVHQPVLPIQPDRPVALERPDQRLGLVQTCVRFADEVGNGFDDLIEQGGVGSG